MGHGEAILEWREDAPEGDRSDATVGRRRSVHPCAAASPRLPDPERLRGPDISFVSAERIQSTGGEPDRGWFRLVPDLVVEIDSPRRRPVIEQRRIQDYLEAGVRLLWVIHAATRSATVYDTQGGVRLVREDGSLEGADVLPGLHVTLAEMFRTD
jgi:Uma2 family endonuclease